MSAVIAFGAISALGEGESALGLHDVGERAVTAVKRDGELAAAGLARPFCARARASESRDDRARTMLLCAIESCAAALDRVLPGWRARRVGLALGTSSGGMRTFEGDQDAFSGTYLGPVLDVARPVAFEPFTLVLGACASSTIAIGLADAWLREDRCDIALAGGFDAVSVFVASGFEALRAVSTERGPRPFRSGRDGLALGEGAAILALVRSAPTSRGHVRGFGASCDAFHLTAPDRTGGGLARAARLAIANAGGPTIDLVSAHGTATDFNDAAEALAIASVAPGEAPVHALKGAIGHTLGAAGALETLAALVAMERSLAPASAGEGEAVARVLDRAERLAAATALKLSSAFGGANAALVLSRDAAPPAEPPRAVHVSSAVAIETSSADPHALAARTTYSEDRLARADLLVRLVLAAACDLQDRVGALAGAGIVVGHGLATRETNRVYFARICAAGAAKGEPRRFPYTSPNASAGECAVALGLTGPSFAVGGGAHGGIEALAAASSLVATGAADRIVVVAADEASGRAVALLVSSAPQGARLTSVTVHLDHASTGETGSLDAVAALLPLVETRPERLEARLPRGGFASARLLWL